MSNKAVERLHRRLKDVLCTRAASVTWSEELPFVLHSAYSRGKTLVFTWLRQFLVLPLCCLMNFCRLPGLQPGGLGTTKWVSFSDPLDSKPSPLAPPRDSLGTGEEVFARPGLAAPSQPPQTRYLSRQQAPPKRLASDLFSFQPRPELGGSPVESCLCPWRWSNQSGIL